METFHVFYGEIVGILVIVRAGEVFPSPELRLRVDNPLRRRGDPNDGLRPGSGN